jgi:hypothetical protein
MHLLFLLWFVFLFWVGPVLVFNDEGIKYHHIYKLKWKDITGAKIIKFFGLEYIHISRRRGFKWWVPLYYKGDIPIEEAILNSAPKGSLVHDLFK